MAMLAVCAVFVAFVSFFLPFVSISFIGTYSYSAIELIEEIIDYPEFPYVGVPISLICTILGIIFSLLALRIRGMEVGTIITSAVGMLIMIVAMISDLGLGISAINYAAIGFYLYEIASLAAIILSVSARYTSKSADASADGGIPSPAPKPTPKPVPPAPGPIPTKKTICPKCKAEQEKDAAFCRFCGTPINNSKKKPYPEPDPEPGPELDPELDPVPGPGPTPPPKPKDGKVICPYCGARQLAGTTTCKYCGTAITGVSSSKVDPVKPISAGKPGKKAVCPHCGARQNEGISNCKYCGTAMK